MLTKRYPPPEWAFFPQARDATGAGSGRTADGVAMNLWPSRGMEVHGFEIKVHRGDWLSELRNPVKSVSVQQYCDRWYLVVSNESVIGNAELPPTWGMMVANGGHLNCTVEAPKLTPEPLDRLFIASLLRNACAVPTDSEMRKQAIEEAKKHASYELDRLREAVQKFEEASGVKLDAWNSGDIGRAVRVVMGMRYDVQDIKRSAMRAQEIANGLMSLIDESKLADLATEEES